MPVSDANAQTGNSVPQLQPTHQYRSPPQGLYPETPATATGPQPVPRGPSAPPELTQLQHAGVGDAGEGEPADGMEERKPLLEEEGMAAEDQGDELMSN